MDWQVTAADGALLCGQQWEAPQPRALIYIAHGLAEHVGRYSRFAEAANAAGFSVAGHDHRGHGRTAANGGELGHFGDRDGFNLMARDLIDGMKAFRATAPDLPLILLGHSMGSFLSQSVMQRAPDDMDMVILSGSNGAPPPLAALGRLIARIERLRLGPRGRSNLIHSLAFDANNKPFEPAPTKLEWLSRDRAEVDTYVADPQCGFVSSTASWIALLDALPGLTKPGALSRLRADQPVLIASGDADPIGANGKGVRQLHDLYQKQGVKDLTLKLYPEARHEILNETNRPEVMTDIISWIEERLPGTGT